MRTVLPEWLQRLWIIGSDEENSDEENDDEEEEESEDEDEEENEEEDDEEDEEESDRAGGAKALRADLAKERKARKAQDKELKKLQREAAARKKKEGSELDQAKQEAQDQKDKSEKLASKLRTNAIDTSIIKLAGKFKFKDIDDALSLVDRTSIEVDQDEDEPDDLEVDESSVSAALKALAKKKPHLIVADGSESPSGSKFNKGGKGGEDSSEDALRKKYSALNRG